MDTPQLTNFQKFKAHIKTIKEHRKKVSRLCFKLGIPFRGLLHDLSKYSIKELSIYKYYVGYKSPHEVARERLGYSPSWYIHPHKNKHHWEYWVDELSAGSAVKIPFKYVIEMFCDFVGAGQTYMKERWKPDSPLKYHMRHKSKRIYHPYTLELLELLLHKLAELGEKEFIKWFRKYRIILKNGYNDHTLDRLKVFL